jgi:hypothetical protein
MFSSLLVFTLFSNITVGPTITIGGGGSNLNLCLEGGGGGTVYVCPKVPGPLPVLGAATAFGFSRKLRKRIKSNNS